MASAIPSESQAGTPRKRAVRFLIAVLVVGGFAAAVVGWLGLRSYRPRRIVHPLDTTSPYANTRPEVGYVGDAACIRCHAEIAETYRQHPMGRSLSSIDATTVTPGTEADGRVLFEADGLEYAIERRDGHVFHRETRRDSSGVVIARNEAEVRFVLGSGNQGASFLIDRDGFLFQSPIGWYSRERRWDLSPGYRKNNPHFDRPVLSTCLYCHANRVEPVEGTLNRYKPPIFRGEAIGCERCHGPGELHVKRPGLVDGRDLSIVNPAALEPSRRDAVCEQCHLMGQQRVVKLDRQDDDFRPGLPFYSVWSVFERSAGTDADRFVGQVEQMHESRCFRDSQGRLGCISCHDPHRRPSAEERVGYFRERCLECHADRGCRLPEATRREQGRGDDCTSCHMPRLETSDIAHVAATNHRIPRRAVADDHPPTGAGERPLVLFHRELMDDRQRVEAERDLGVALSKLGRGTASMALPLLDAALASRPDDLVARQARGTVVGQFGRFEDGLASFRSALDQEPDRESARVGAADLAARAGRGEEAIADLRRAIAINPWRAAYRMDLAALQFDRRDWPAAATACREASASTPPTSRPGSCSSDANYAWETSKPPAPNSRPCWDSIPPIARS